MQGLYRLNLFLAAQHAALELEVLKAIARMGRLGQAHYRFGVHGLFVAQALPVIGLVRLAGIR